MLYYRLKRIGLIFLLLGLYSCTNQEKKINRYDLVNRHNVIVNGYDSLNALSIGNGNFTFTTGLTGLQTFYKAYENGVPLGTQSNWGWHSFNNKENFTRKLGYRYHNYQGRKVPYLAGQYNTKREEEATEYFRQNPHRLHLGIIGLFIKKENGSQVKIGDIKNANHHLNLWTGKITSTFEVEGKQVKVEVFCHQKKDMISARIQSSLISNGQLSVEWKFPYPATDYKMHHGYDFSSRQAHQSTIEKESAQSALISRQLDSTRYFTQIEWQTPGEWVKKGKHHFQLLPENKNQTLNFSCCFSTHRPQEALPNFGKTRSNNLSAWKKFWNSGGAVDFSSSTDPRADELERRVVLSQYLTRIQCAGSLPPAETGLSYNSWYGKFHLEMHWWHAAHFAVWNRPHILKKQINYYSTIYDEAERTADRQGFKGLRWPKMVGPEGKNSPSGVGSYLIWQQPHFIYFAEQLYQLEPTKETLNKYKDLVFATAEFMADFAVYNRKNDTYNLLPPLIPAQEHWPRETTSNPPFELAYWHWGLKTAQKWRKRLNLPVDSVWKKVKNKLAAPDHNNKVYFGIKGATNSYSNPDYMRDHPMVLGSYGMLPKWEKIDPNKMENTLETIISRWNWLSTWGWDYPMVAMCATRLGKPKTALKALLMDTQKNTYLKNGHNYQSDRLRIYLPGNGGLLKAVALMCAGWKGCKKKNPGFPDNGNWNVKWEDFEKGL